MVHRTLIVNTFGILEIVYLIWFRPKNNGDDAPETRGERFITDAVVVNGRVAERSNAAVLKTGVSLRGP